MSDEIDKAVERIRVARAHDYFLAESWREVIRAELLAAFERGGTAMLQRGDGHAMVRAMTAEEGWAHERRRADAAEARLAALREAIEGMLLLGE